MFNQSSAPRMTIESRDDPRSGFTIIEVVLVLAIAGLIFLMVFVALPALQRSQRDTQRRDDIARLATAITQYQTNNNNALPTDGTALINNYLGGSDEFSDPLGGAYTISIKDRRTSSNGNASNSYSSGNYQISLYTYANCEGEAAVANNNKLNYAIVYNLEGSGTYCSDNS